MLRQCIERCPEEVWGAGKHPRTFWRTAYHALFYTHFYLSEDSEAFTAWSRHERQAVVTWSDDEGGIPPVETTYSQAEVLSYLDEVYERVDSMVDALDLDRTDSGFSWYPIPKLDHQLVSIRHLGVHVGQLQEVLYSHGVDLDWVGKR